LRGLVKYLLRKRVFDNNEEMSKREAKDDLLPIPTLGDVANETDFESLRSLLDPIKNRAVTELSEELRVALKKRGGDESELLLLSFFAACDAYTKAASLKRPNVSSDESAPGENQLLLFSPLFPFSSPSLLQRSPTCQLLKRCWSGSRAWPCSMALPCDRMPSILGRVLRMKTLGTTCVGTGLKWCDPR
jgi:hypothetical protein